MAELDLDYADREAIWAAWDAHVMLQPWTLEASMLSLKLNSSATYISPAAQLKRGLAIQPKCTPRCQRESLPNPVDKPPNTNPNPIPNPNAHSVSVVAVVSERQGENHFSLN